MDRKQLIMTIDLEDWFQVENLKGTVLKKDWNNYEYRIEKNTDIILELLTENGSGATFFVLGWIAEKFPDLIIRIKSCGFEIASHGYSHDLTYEFDKDEFMKDLYRTKKILEDITGEKIIGYRAPSFSITDELLEILISEGYVYDSSYFPAVVHDRYGRLSKYKDNPNKIYEVSKGFYEVPLSCFEIFGLKIPWAGGGYFRIVPFNFYSSVLKSIVKKNSYYNFYIHPWEFDTGQPKLDNLKVINSFRHYHNLHKTYSKYSKLLKDFSFSSVVDSLPNKLHS